MPVKMERLSMGFILLVRSWTIVALEKGADRSAGVIGAMMPVGNCVFYLVRTFVSRMAGPLQSKRGRKRG